MPEQAKVVVTNTTPLIALTAATGNLEVLRVLYARVVVPYEVAEEVRVGGKEAFGLDVFQQASWLEINPAPVILPYLQNTLDRGEASVIFGSVLAPEAVYTEVTALDKSHSARLQSYEPFPTGEHA